ncbi:YqeG family HAD IIIA-type phosphatase [Oxynema sp. CENA135]|uniref:YqeG family HAD IIIA-type phosphatase n=1 Tax=Oxynema sp. CENA135 TaxID=984206 RepID=UPI00190C1D46|nr:YqeG family HAD IIIA-type phosphatase [Oxynema sp. CENA135]MBK4729242.1 YqeG family HAD IIIA-type phosphatase [Oxynema sp. CENA135]
MSWGKLLQPDLLLGGSIINLQPEVLDTYQLKGLVLDVDETLVPFTEREVSEPLQEWVAQFKPLVPLWLVSNNISENRIGSIAKSLELPYITGAAKPSRRKLRQAVTAMNLPVQQVAMVGDRLFTDVLAGNRLGMFTILVDPMVDPGDVFHPYRLRSFEVWLSQILGASLHLDR